MLFRSIAYGEAWANVSNTPFREYKHWVHEGGISTPLIAHWPKGIPEPRRGQFETQPGHLIDIMATCVQCRGCEPACPSGVPFGRLIEGTRQHLAETKRLTPWWQRWGFAVLPKHRSKRLHLRLEPGTNSETSHRRLCIGRRKIKSALDCLGAPCESWGWVRATTS